MPEDTPPARADATAPSDAESGAADAIPAPRPPAPSPILPANAPPPPPPTLEQRLRRLRQRALIGPFVAACFGSPAGCLAGYFCGSMLATILMLFIFPFATSSSSNTPLMAYILPLTDVVLCLLGLIAGAWGARVAGRAIAAKAYTRIWRELWTTNLLALIVHEDYTREMLAQSSQTYLLRTMAPPPPRNFEQQLEFAACYLPALRRLQWGTGRVDAGPLWQGAFTWFCVQRQGAACGCLALLLYGMGYPLWVLAYFATCSKLGALAAICDCLLAGAPGPHAAGPARAAIKGSAAC